MQHPLTTYYKIVATHPQANCSFREIDCTFRGLTYRETYSHQLMAKPADGQKLMSERSGTTFISCRSHSIYILTRSASLTDCDLVSFVQLQRPSDRTVTCQGRGDFLPIFTYSKPLIVAIILTVLIHPVYSHLHEMRFTYSIHGSIIFPGPLSTPLIARY